MQNTLQIHAFLINFISLTSGVSGATIYYTTDGTIPDRSSEIYTSPVQIMSDGTNITIKAFAVKDFYPDSDIAESTYTICYYGSTCSTMAPFFSVPGDTYNQSISVSLSSLTPGAKIYYTTDGSQPSISSTIYSTPITIEGNGNIVTIKAFASKSQSIDSDIVSSTYFIDSTYDITQPQSELTISDYNTQIIGNWFGHVETPWGPPYNVEIIFNNMETFYAWTTSQQTFPNSYTSWWGPAFYYGEDIESPTRTFSIYDVLANGQAVGRIAVCFFDTCDAFPDNWKFITFYNNFKNLTFEYWHFNENGPVKFFLTRRESI